MEQDPDPIVRQARLIEWLVRSAPMTPPFSRDWTKTCRPRRRIPGRRETRQTLHFRTLKPKVLLGDPIATGSHLGVDQGKPPPVLVQVAASLKRPPRSMEADLKKRLHSTVAEGQELAAASGPLGMGKKVVTSPVSGEVTAVLVEMGAIVIQPESMIQAASAPFASRVTKVSAQVVELTTSGQTIEGTVMAGSDVAGGLAWWVAKPTLPRR